MRAHHPDRPKPSRHEDKAALRSPGQDDLTRNPFCIVLQETQAGPRASPKTIWRIGDGPATRQALGHLERSLPVRRNTKRVVMRLALYQPDIPQNTGNILRMAACLGVAVDVIGPTGFDMTDRALRRAGLDYLEHVEIARHLSFEAYLGVRRPVHPADSPALPSPRPDDRPSTSGRIVLLSTRSAVSYLDFDFRPEDTLLLGRESAGVPDQVHACVDARVLIPMRPGLRSLNIASAAALVLGEALRQTKGFPATTPATQT